MKYRVKNIAIFWENLDYGGMNTFIENLINSNQFKKINIKLITNKNNEGIKSIKRNITNKNYKLITYTSLNAIKINSYALKIIFWLFRPVLLIVSLIQSLLILKKINPDTLLAACGGYGNFRTDSISLISAKMLNISSRILSIHHSYTEAIAWKKFLKLVEKYIFKCSTGLIFGSKAVKNNIQNKTNYLSYNKNFKVIHHGVLIKRKSKKNLSLKKIFVTKKNIIKIGMLSRIEYDKGHFDLIKAFSLLSEKNKKKFKVFFIGPVDNFNLKKIELYINELNLNKFIKITGFLNYDSLQIINNLDIVLSLTKTFEGFGLSIAESLLAKKNVIATDVGAIKEFLNKKNSRLIKPNNIKAIYLSLLNIIKNKKKWKKINLTGFNMIKNNFSSEITAKNYLKYFELATSRNNN